MKLKPTTNYVIIEPSEVETQTQSGLLLPQGSAEAPAKGVVIASAVDEIKESQIVFFKKWMDQEIEVEGKKYKVVKGEDVIAIYE